MGTLGCAPIRPTAPYEENAMLLERTIAQLDIGPVSPDQAEEMGHLGFLQWLGALKGNESYIEAASQAYARARPASAASPALAVFCELLAASSEDPLAELNLRLPTPTRRGGAKARRAGL
ncbi:MAG: hypothetical protein MK180_15135 [Rhodobacteraceae bacterium]|nr:hypothetical protein [Paracoccaceae bacterium]